MAGVKGKSGGAREGAGRKPTAPQLLEADSDDALEFLRQVMREKGADGRLRIRAAIAVAQIEKTARPGKLGKKGAQTTAAKEAGVGRFAAGAPPKLAVVGNGEK
jgi:phage terminase small subunit